MRFEFRGTLTTLAVCLAAGSLAAQSGQEPGAPTFTARTNLVLVPAVVTDKSGARITGLSKDDFQLFENGQPRRIDVFEHVRTEPRLVVRPPAPPQQFTNVMVTPTEAPTRVTIILLDTLNTRFTDTISARHDLIKFLSEQVQTSEPMALLVLSEGGLRVVHDFTTDPKVLVAALKRAHASLSSKEKAAHDAADASAPPPDLKYALKVTGCASGCSPAEFVARAGASFGLGSDGLAADEAQAIMDVQLRPLNQFQDALYHADARTTLEALRAIGQAFSGVPGRKALIWMTGGVPFVADDASGLGFSSTLQALYHLIRPSGGR